MIGYIDKNLIFSIAVASLAISWSLTVAFGEKNREIKKLSEEIRELKQEKRKNDRENQELKKDNYERIEELKLDKKNLVKLNEVIVALLNKATFGNNFTINWQNCTITSSQIDSKAISRDQVKMAKELEPNVRIIKEILTEQEDKVDKKIVRVTRTLRNNKFSDNRLFINVVPDRPNVNLVPDLEKPSMCNFQ